MIDDMEYTYEFLRKCHGLRFKAVQNDNPIEGIVKVEKDGVVLCHGEETLDNFDFFHRLCGIRITPFFDFNEQGVSDFEIVPRDPETYKDWQVGDKIIKDDIKYVVIFRCGKVVLFEKSDNEYCNVPYTCKELFNAGGLLVLTDIEKQILDERQKAEWQPQDGDICYAESRTGYKDVFIYKAGYRKTEYYASSASITLGAVISDENIITLRPATEEEKHKLFDALAKQGKRWNAEKKVVEDIPKPYEFRKGEPVLVRDYGGFWIIKAFTKMQDSYCKYVATSNGVNDCGYRECIPYNEETMHLLGTTENYKEGE